jgi:hypothetical protein
LTGAPGVTEAVGTDHADAAPPSFEASTPTRIVRPSSSAVRR